ncbi:MAG: hypothetical protein ACFCUX_02300 [Candidatus Methylacidiphilales bacterium]
MSLYAGHAVADIKIVPMPSTVDPSPLVLHGWSGETMPVHLLVQHQEDRQVHIRARLYQLAPDLAAPLGEAFSVVDGLVLQKRLFHKVEAPITLPRVKRAVAVTLKLEAREEGEDSWVPGGQVFIVIHPPKDDLVKQCAALARQLANRGADVFLVGNEPFFATLLNQSGIPYEHAASFDQLPVDRPLVCFGRTAEWDISPLLLNQNMAVRLVTDIFHEEGIHVRRMPQGLDLRLNHYRIASLSEARRWSLFSEILQELHQALPPQPR